MDSQHPANAPKEPVFLCDAMLGGLARWLRAAGYKASFDVHASDGELVRRALQEKACLLTSDAGILKRYAVAEGMVQCVFIPRSTPLVQQLAHVLRTLNLPLRDSRCMDCGGELLLTPLAEVHAEVPEKVKSTCKEFFRCSGCHKVYWRGTHWQSIEALLRSAAAHTGGDQRQPSG